jgi:hypothetical protein
VQGDISDEQWDILKLAFLTTGRVAVLSDREGDRWMYDYRFIEAVRGQWSHPPRRISLA